MIDMKKNIPINKKLSKKVMVFVCCYKNMVQLNEDGYYSILVGVGDKKKKKNQICDNTGDNIAKKNFSFCELTAVYWMWKNVQSDIVGLTHYRRFFYRTALDNKILSKNSIIKILEKYDIIVPQKGYCYPKTIQEAYAKSHVEKDLVLCREIIAKKYPDYLDSFDKVMNSKSYHQYNMFITKKEISDQYSSWLFDILLELDSLIDYTNPNRSKYNMRVTGFLGERLFNVWLEKNNHLLIKEIPVFNTKLNLFKQRVVSIIKYFLRWI